MAITIEAERDLSRMRIVSWNCNGAFARKLSALDQFDADLLVIQEASERDILAMDTAITHWVGKGHRGLAVIGKNGTTFRVDPIWDPTLPWFTPVHIGNLRVLAVWASVLTNSRRYVRLVHEALDLYQDFLEHDQAIVIGDLNSNTVFDGKHRGLSHTDLVDRLSSKGLTSVWHHQHNEAHGQESRPTFYMYRRPEKTWHLDYAFVSNAFLTNASLTLGEHDPWLTLSDHIPLVLDI
jgi:exonuclease III